MSEYKEIVLDKSKPLLDYLDNILLDEKGNQAVVKRTFTGTLVRDAQESLGNFGGTPSMLGKIDELNKKGFSYRYKDIKYSKPFIAPLSNEFFAEGGVKVIGRLV